MMKIKYFYQLLISHISLLIIAFLILSLLFTKFVENYIFENKVQELDSFGRQILTDLSTRVVGNEQFLKEYSQLLVARNITYIIFDSEGNFLYPQTGNRISLSGEFENLTKGKRVTIREDFKRFDKVVSLVAIPLMHNDQMIGGVLLYSPISWTIEMIQELNHILFITMIVSLTATLLLSWILSKSLLRRIAALRKATSMISAGNYNVNIHDPHVDEISELAQDFNNMAAKLKVSNEEIQRLENRRRKFIADVSHEMRTPLTTISGLAEGMKNNLIPEEEKAKGMELIDREAKRMIRLVNENLDYEKIRSNQVRLNASYFHLLDVFELVKDQLELPADKKGNQIILQVDENLEVYADYDRLLQILINIVKNSIQFTSNGTISIIAEKGEQETIIKIKDNGIGINPDEIHAIWDRFYKADLSRTTSTFGEFGIGLSIVKQLVTLHKGKIDVESEPEKGTEFTIRLPIVEKDKSRSAAL
ncbi:HAMP domain-containing histidine kinase [Bacillaceae bacterium Marseille-Q3522]|nr:HAMP domain-containing histidine kinase [Bacillaceae bacterium Marseille-Q3522]